MFLSQKQIQIFPVTFDASYIEAFLSSHGVLTNACIYAIYFEDIFNIKIYTFDICCLTTGVICCNSTTFIAKYTKLLPSIYHKMLVDNVCCTIDV